MRKILIIAVLLALGLTTAVGATRGHHEEKVNICHVNHSERNPWIAIEVDESSLGAHFKHGDFFYQGELKHGKPSDKKWCENNEPRDLCKNIEGKQLEVPEGKVRDEQGNCVDKTPEPTPTPVPAPVPTPAPQPTQTVTEPLVIGGK